MSIQQKYPTILIVDDDEINIKLLEAILHTENYQTITANTANSAIKILDTFLPDLILLDVMMPELDGFELCRIIKEDENKKFIPIIMVTALNDKIDRIKASRLGADDFLTKPIDHIELLIRVKSLLRLKSYHDEITQKNIQLLKLEKVKEDLMHMIIHDLTTPLSVISMCIEMSLKEENTLLSPTLIKRLNEALNRCRDLDLLIRSILNIKRMETGKLKLNKEMSDMISLFKNTLSLFTYKLQEKKINLSFNHEKELPPINIDKEIIKRVISNLVENGVRQTPVKGNIEIDINILEEEGKKFMHCYIKDSGPGILPEYHNKIFEKFEHINLKKSGITPGISGLGLTFCKLAIEAHNGKIWVESKGDGKGSIFNFTLPF